MIPDVAGNAAVQGRVTRRFPGNL